jgi:hypothetical protein
MSARPKNRISSPCAKTSRLKIVLNDRFSSPMILMSSMSRLGLDHRICHFRVLQHVSAKRLNKEDADTTFDRGVKAYGSQFLIAG